MVASAIGLFHNLFIGTCIRSCASICFQIVFKRSFNFFFFFGGGGGREEGGREGGVSDLAQRYAFSFVNFQYTQSLLLFLITAVALLPDQAFFYISLARISLSLPLTPRF